MRNKWAAAGSVAIARISLTSIFMPDAATEQINAFNELERLSGSPECAVRFLDTVADIDVRELLPHVKAPILAIVRDYTKEAAEENHQRGGYYRLPQTKRTARETVCVHPIQHITFVGRQ